MAYSFDGTSQYLTADTPPRTQAPLSFSAICKPANVTTVVNYSIIAIANSAGTGDSVFVLQHNAANLFMRAKNGAADGESVRLNLLTSASFFLTAGTSSGIAQRLAYVNETAGGQNTTSVTPENLNKLSIAADYRNSTSPTSFFGGLAAEVAIWSVALTAAEIASLAKGFKPTRVRPQSLVFYAPLIRGLQDTRGGLTITNNNSATVADHPRVY